MSRWNDLIMGKQQLSFQTLTNTTVFYPDFFYKNCFFQSYPINNDTRGHAIVFVTTEDREGFEKDMEALQQLFLDLNVICDDYVIDPTKEVIKLIKVLVLKFVPSSHLLKNSISQYIIN